MPASSTKTHDDLVGGGVHIQKVLAVLETEDTIQTALVGLNGNGDVMEEIG